MKELLDKLGSYNVFNYLLPGVLFAASVEALTPIKLLQKDIVVGVFIYYFFGLVISRIGSLIIEPILRKMGVVSFTPYEDFVRASKIDNKLEVLSESNNMYRTFCGLIVSVAAIKLYLYISNYLPILQTASSIVGIVGLFVLFALSYKKQSAYIKRRIMSNLKDN